MYVHLMPELVWNKLQNNFHSSLYIHIPTKFPSSWSLGHDWQKAFERKLEREIF